VHEFAEEEVEVEGEGIELFGEVDCDVLWKRLVE